MTGDYTLFPINHRHGVRVRVSPEVKGSALIVYHARMVLRETFERFNRPYILRINPRSSLIKVVELSILPDGSHSVRFSWKGGVYYPYPTAALPALGA